MKILSKQFVPVIFLFLAIAFSGFAQSSKQQEKKAQRKVKELNELIVSIDTTLALTENQRKQIFNLHLSKMREYKIVMENGGSKESGKTVFKKYYQKINGVLTLEQKKARTKAKKIIKNKEANVKQEEPERVNEVSARSENSEASLTKAQQRKAKRKAKKKNKE